MWFFGGNLAHSQRIRKKALPKQLLSRVALGCAWFGQLPSRRHTGEIAFLLSSVSLSGLKAAFLSPSPCYFLRRGYEGLQCTCPHARLSMCKSQGFQAVLLVILQVRLKLLNPLGLLCNVVVPATLCKCMLLVWKPAAVKCN